MQQQQRQFDITVFGVTGFTGKLVARYLDQLVGERRLENNGRICFAGRSLNAMQNITKNTLKHLEPEYCYANVENEQTIYQMAANCHVLLQLVGPYEALGGEIMIKACITAKTHYVDITGEGRWIDRMKSLHGNWAKQQGVCLVPFAGQDCVPADLAGWFTTSQLPKEDFAESHAVLQTCVRLPAQGAQLSNGTFKTIINQQGLDFNMAATTPSSESVTLVEEIQPALAVLPIRLFPDFRVVEESHRAAHANDGKFENSHAVVLPNRVMAHAVQVGLKALPYVLQIPYMRYLLNKLSDSGGSFKSPIGAAPSQLNGGGGGVVYTTYGILKMYPLLQQQTKPIETIVTKLDCDRDPYDVTAICCVQTALALLQQCADKSIKPGFQTPVSAVGGQELFERCYECFRVQLVSRL